MGKIASHDMYQFMELEKVLKAAKYLQKPERAREKDERDRTMMSKKNYIAFARMLKERLDSCGKDLGDATRDNWYTPNASFALGKLDELKVIAEKLADILKADNDRFDRVIFSNFIFDRTTRDAITKAEEEAAEAAELMPGELTKDVERAY
tara:strand:+ start:741 stop:1193 length:453 start_codon:yes stop_codon:yes gene_type:complete